LSPGKKERISHIKAALPRAAGFGSVITDEPTVLQWWWNSYLNWAPPKVRRDNAGHDVSDCLWPGWHTTCYIPTAIITMRYSWPLH
jgi:hypothetical protein